MTRRSVGKAEVGQLVTTGALLLICHLVSPLAAPQLSANAWPRYANQLANSRSMRDLKSTVSASFGLGCSPTLPNPMKTNSGLSTSSLEPDFLFVSGTGSGRQTRLRALSSSPEAIISAGFDPRKQATTVLIPGWQQRPGSPGWLTQIESHFRSSGLAKRENLFVLDYTKVSRREYQFASSASRAVGQIGARFLQKLVQQMGVRPNNIRLVGGSLGAHVAGFMGRELRKLLGDPALKVGSVVALDPAGPCFEAGRDRLQRSDGLQVLVYHYDAKLLGNRDQLGHRDVFVNGGSGQPGAGSRAGGLNHLRAFSVAAVQLVGAGSRSSGADSTCQMVAYECSNYSRFRSGGCAQCGSQNERCQLMSFNWQHPGVGEPTPEGGFAPNRDPGSPRMMYVSTSGHSPYCQHHWQVLVELSQTGNSSGGRRLGPIQLELNGADPASSRSLPVTVDFDLNAPSSGIVRKSALLLTEGRPSRIVAASVGGRNGIKNINSIQVNYMSSIDRETRQYLSSRLCPVDNSQSQFELCSS